MICSLFLSFKFFSFRDKARRLSVRMIKWVWADLRSTNPSFSNIKSSFYSKIPGKIPGFTKCIVKKPNWLAPSLSLTVSGHVARVPGVTGRGWGPGCWRPSLGACRDPSAATCRTWTGAGTRAGCRPAGENIVIIFQCIWISEQIIIATNFIT